MEKNKKGLMRTVFINKKNGQATITIPKKMVFEYFGMKQPPKKVWIKQVS